MADIPDPNMYSAIRRAIMGPQPEPLTIVPAPTNVVDLRTRKPHYPPNSLARALTTIAALRTASQRTLASIDAVRAASQRIPTDG
jgi:hypothetical protein